MSIKKTNNKIEVRDYKEKDVNQEKTEESEAQLSIDIFETENFLFIFSPISAVKSEDLKISVEDKILTIKGKREKPHLPNGKYIYQECYWGKFSRKIVLPREVNSSKIEATLQDGLLTIKIERIKKKGKKQISVKEIE